MAELQPSEAEVIGEIARLVKNEIGLPHPVQAGSDLLQDLALDSLSLLTLVVGLEDRYRVMLKEEDAAEIRTVAQLAALVVQRAGEQP